MGRGRIQMADAAPVRQAHGRHPLPLDPPQEPGVPVPAAGLDQVPQDGDGMGISRRKVLKLHRHAAAADHAQAGGVPLDEAELPQGVRLLLQQLRRQPLTLEFHIPAADGAGGPAAGKDGHHGSGPPGGGPLGGGHAHQLRRLSRLQGVDELSEELPHLSRSLHSRRPGSAPPP